MTQGLYSGWGEQLSADVKGVLFGWCTTLQLMCRSADVDFFILIGHVTVHTCHNNCLELLKSIRYKTLFESQSVWSLLFFWCKGNGNASRKLMCGSRIAVISSLKTLENLWSELFSPGQNMTGPISFLRQGVALRKWDALSWLCCWWRTRPPAVRSLIVFFIHYSKTDLILCWLSVVHHRPRVQAKIRKQTVCVPEGL